MEHKQHVPAPYPAWRYFGDGRKTVVRNQAEDQALGEGWTSYPTVAEPLPPPLARPRTLDVLWEEFLALREDYMTLKAQIEGPTILPEQEPVDLSRLGKRDTTTEPAEETGPEPPPDPKRYPKRKGE